MKGFEDFDIGSSVRGDYKSADLFLAPKGRKYAELVENVLKEFNENSLELVIDESSMPLPYYEAMEIPLDVFLEKYEVEDEKNVSRKKTVNMCKDLLELGFFDIGFRGEKIALHISHNGYVNIKPLKIEKEKFREKIEKLGEKDD